MSSTQDTYLDVNKVGDTFSITSKLADYSIHHDWKDGYDALNNPNIQSKHKFLWKTVSSSCEDIGSDIYKKIINYIDNISNVDTCEIHSLYSFAKLYGYNESLLFTDFSFPTEILELINIFSINKSYLSGPNSILTASSKTAIRALSGDDSSYLDYVKNVFINTISNFCNLKYRESELSYSTDYVKDGIIWANNIPKYTTNLFKFDTESTPDILLKKISLNIPTFFPERRHVDDIQKGIKKLTDFSTTEQIILNMEIDRRAKVKSYSKNISKYSYERENKVGEYLRFVTLLSTNAFDTIPYTIDIKKSLIENQDISSIIIYNSDIKDYELDYTLIENTSKKLVDFCLRVSYIRETIKNQAQKYYMSGTENLLINLIKEVLFTTLYNDINSTSGYWRYLSDNTSLFKKNIKPDSNLNVDIIEYSDPIDYYNIKAVPTDVVGENGINARYWEQENLYDGDISKDDLLKFYNKLGLGDIFTYTYAPSTTDLVINNYGRMDQYSLSGFLSTIFNAGATTDIINLSAFGSVLSGNTITYGNGAYVIGTKEGNIYRSNDLKMWTPVLSSATPSIWNNISFCNNRFIATNETSGIYYSLDGTNWTYSTSTSSTSSFKSITYGNGIYIATNYLSGIYTSNDGITWVRNTTTNGKLSGYSPIAYGNNLTYKYGSSYLTIPNLYLTSRYNNINSTDGVYYSTNGTTWNVVSSPVINGFNSIAYGNNRFTLTNEKSGIYYINMRDNVSTTLPNNIAFLRSTDSDVLTSGFRGISYNNGTWSAANSSLGMYYSTSADIWNRSNDLSSGQLSAYNKVVNGNNKFFAIRSLSDNNLYTSVSGNTWSKIDTTIVTDEYINTDPIFLKYSGNVIYGDIPFANIKNSIHSSYQLHPFIAAFKQYTTSIQGIKNLFNTVIPSKIQCYNDIKLRIDNYGNSVNFWLDDNVDFSGYRSQYEESDEKNNNKLLNQDSPFNFDALDNYINNFTDFNSTSSILASAYYSYLNLTSSMQNKITNQLVEFYNNIKDLENYRIYKYGKDSFDNVYILYKKNNLDNEKGQLWIRLKNHPIAFPAFILDSINPLLLSEYGQITNTTMNTLNSVLKNSYDVSYAGPLSGQLSIDNVTLSVSATSGENDVYISTLLDNVDFYYTDETKKSFYTTNITSNSLLSTYFTNEISGDIIGNDIKFSGFYPTTDNIYYITFKAGGTISLLNDYIDVIIQPVGNNVFQAITSKKFYDNLNTIYDFGFNYNKDIMFIDFTPEGAISSYSNTNTMFGEIDYSNIDLAGNRILQYVKETEHNLETLQQSMIDNYDHVDTIINEKDIYFIYKNMEYSSSISQSDYYNIYFLIFKYNKNDGLKYSTYEVPVKYNILQEDPSWCATISDSILSIAFMSSLPKNDVLIGNYISGYEVGIGGKASFNTILETSFLNGFTVVQFNVENNLPISYDNIKYFYKHTDLGFYPQYPGVVGKNKIYMNPEIYSDSFYRLQLYMESNLGNDDFIYEQTFKDTIPVSGIYADMNTVAFSAISAYTPETFLYTTSAYELSTNPSLSSEPMKWFRKYDLSGNYTEIDELSAGIDLSGNTLLPSSYIYHSKEENFLRYNNEYYPRLDTAASKDSLFDYYTLSSITSGNSYTYSTVIKNGNNIYYIPYNETNLLSGTLSSFSSVTSIPVNDGINSYNKFLNGTILTSGSSDRLYMASEHISGGIVSFNITDSIFNLTPFLSSDGITNLSGESFTFGGIIPISGNTIALTNGYVETSAYDLSADFNFNKIMFATLSSVNDTDVFVVDTVTISGSQTFNNGIIYDNKLIISPHTVTTSSDNPVIGIINLENMSYNSIDISTYIDSDLNSYLYSDIAIDNNDNIILSPYNSNSIIIINDMNTTNPVLRSVSLSSDIYDYSSASRNENYNKVTVLDNNQIIFIPYSSRYIIELDIQSDSLLEYANIQLDTIFSDAIQLDNTSILLVPYYTIGGTVWTDNDLSYGILELDQNYPIKVYYRSDGVNITGLYFLGINDLVNTSASQITQDGANIIFEYNFAGIIKSYRITLISKSNKQFIIERI